MLRLIEKSREEKKTQVICSIECAVSMDGFFLFFLSFGSTKYQINSNPISITNNINDNIICSNLLSSPSGQITRFSLLVTLVSTLAIRFSFFFFFLYLITGVKCGAVEFYKSDAIYTHYNDNITSL